MTRMRYEATGVDILLEAVQGVLDSSSTPGPLRGRCVVSAHIEDGSVRFVLEGGQGGTLSGVAAAHVRTVVEGRGRPV